MFITQTVFNIITPARCAPVAFAISMAIVLMGCNAQGDSHEATLQVQGFETYVAEFEKAAAEHGQQVRVDDLIIQFGQVDLDGETGGRGVCEIAQGNTPVITISQKAWDSSTEEEREELIFHEMGHCVLKKVHVAGIDQQMGIPRSIMNPYKIDGSVYSQFKDYYLADLFN